MKRTRLKRAFVLSAVLLAATGIARAAELNGGGDCAAPGADALVPVLFVNDAPDTGPITGLQFDVIYDPGVANVSGELLPGDSLADHAILGREIAPGVFRVLVYSPTNAYLGNAGTILSIPFAIDGAATGMQVPLQLPLNGEAPYTGPGAILASIGAVKKLPAADPDPGEIDLISVAVGTAPGQCIGGATTMTCSSSGPSAVGYQWIQDAAVIPGATTDTYSIPVVEPFHTGQYRCRVVDSVCGEVVSSAQPFVVDESPCAPQNLRVYDPGTGGTLVAEWQPNPATSIDQYTLRWGTTPGGPYPQTSGLPPTGGTTIAVLAEGQRLYFRVSAAVEGNQSPFSNEGNAVPTGAGLDLPQAPEYGYNTPVGETAHPDVITYRFPPRSGDVTIWFNRFDIDDGSEVAVRVNGQPVTCFDASETEVPCVTGVPGNWAGKTTIRLPDAFVKDDEVNVLTFDNLLFDDPPTPEEQWGLREVSIKLPAPQVTAQPWSQTVDLTIDQGGVEPTLASYDVHRGTTPGFFVSTGNRIGTCTIGGEACSVFRDDLALDDFQTYYYVVRPGDTIGNKGFESTERAATPTDAAVTPIFDLGLDKSGTDDVTLLWSNVVTGRGVSHYEIHEGGTRDNVVFTGATTTAQSYARLGDLTDGLVHYYFVIVVDGSGFRSEHLGSPP